MSPESQFYQISGFKAHSNQWFERYNDKPLVGAILATKSILFRPRGQDSPVELVLGILPSGASYLLMTSEQALEFTHRHHCPFPRDPPPWRATAFLSLSPIYFNSADELSAKIATYKQRPRKKNRRDVEAPLDNSRANRGYVHVGSDVVHYRAYFEHQRILYGLLTGDLVPEKVGLVPPSWLNCVRVVSLVFGEWSFDNRRKENRLQDPWLVDVGWTDALFPSFFEQLTGSTVHLKLSSKMKNRNPKDPYFSEVVKDDQEGLYLRLRTLLSHDTNKSGIPLIVLVHDEGVARAVLSRAGLDVDTWSSGLSTLLLPAPARSRCDSNDTPSLPGPIIVDTQKLVKAVMETNPGHTVPDSAKVLHMQTDTGTCAGDDSLLQLRMWTWMAQGSAIDEQHQKRLSHQPDCAQVLAPPQQQANVEVDPNDIDPSDIDPNDIDPNDMDPNDMQPGPRPTIADDFSSDDDW